MNSVDASLVDLSGVPPPDESAPEWIQAQTILAPLVGVRHAPADPAHPTVRLLRETPAHLKATRTTASPSPTPWFRSANEAPDTSEKLILRGWYATREEPRWSPCQSRFGGRAGKHRGVDLAAPPGVHVLAPVTGWATLNPLGTHTRYGQHLFIATAADKPFGILLAHLEKGTGTFPRLITTGESIAILGFSAGGLYGGQPNTYGKYDTHLHVEVVSESGHEDPITFFKLTARYADDPRCFFPADPFRISIRFPHPALNTELPHPDWRMVLLKLYAAILVLPSRLLNGLAHVLFPRECATIIEKIAALRREHVTEIERYVDAVLLETLISGEDRRFLFHRGFDPIGILRAMLALMRGTRQGGSTIEQQLVRTMTQRRGISLRRKWLEILLSAHVAARFSKRATAEAYLGAGYYGAGMNGLAQAHRRLQARAPTLENDPIQRAAELVARLKYPEPEKPAPPRQQAIAQRVRYLIMLRANMERAGWFTAADWSLHDTDTAPEKTTAIDRTIAQIKRHEGLRLQPYRCSANQLTIGYGRNLDATGIRPDEAELMLQHDLREAQVRIAEALPWTRNLNEPRRAVLEQMAFNLGIDRLLGFQRMLTATQRGDWTDAADEMLNSRWHRQVGPRARELAEQMRTGRWPEEPAMPPVNLEMSP